MRARLNYKSQYHYRVVPDILEHFSTLDLKAGENTRFWLTIHVPENAKPGDYTGSVRFECKHGHGQPFPFDCAFCRSICARIPTRSTPSITIILTIAWSLPRMKCHGNIFAARRNWNIRTWRRMAYATSCCRRAALPPTARASSISTGICSRRNSIFGRSTTFAARLSWASTPAGFTPST